ncbi:RsmE family RNA methyltransferase [Bacteriovorax sp. PP10]|uniref:Ribosomal RNA small subunit methyltransferase E n=1 Tax=Bacteriovorax antarcticus TaxID=3088717 RepID=A0ABU5VUN2_9BACT|nr:RsmE family RNA methyltransferase [Bacteriovorax sp. PP10]MEA9356763.1 RsmE family RNA methyltransferase [Bacteriovorax sp. PP10]
MNSLILKNSDGIITDSKIIAHMFETLKANPGDVFKCTILDQGLCLGTIESLTKSECKLKLSEISPAQPQWFNLVVGISRPQTTKKVLEHATTFGAKKIHFFKAALSEKSYLDSKVFESAECEEHLLAGLSQAAIYGSLPIVKTDKYNPADSYADIPQKFILDLNATENFLDLSSSINFDTPVTLAIGPERGFISEDIARFHAAGFKSVKISSSILRVEHAIYSAVSQLELIRGRY